MIFQASWGDKSFSEYVSEYSNFEFSGILIMILNLVLSLQWVVREY